MKKRKVKSDKFPPYDINYGPIKWMNQHDVYEKYRNLGMTKEFLAYNRSNQFRNRKSITEEDILKCKRTGLAGVQYRNDTTDKFVKSVFGGDNLVPFENKTPNTHNTHNKKNTQDKVGQKS
tara:strand:+ start:49 stop:411 length:363 start_codon:yes stop_codon:yes gene_type:complete